MRTIGMDIHKRVIQVAIKDEVGALSSSHRFECTRVAIETFAREVLRRDDRVAVENTTNTWAIVDVLTGFVAEVVVSNPLRTKAIAEAKIKTDKVDAAVLADLLRAGYLPTVWQPDERTRELRRLVSRRAGLVSDRVSYKNRVHATLHQRLIAPPVKALFGKSGRAWLAELELDELGRDELASTLRLLDAVGTEIKGVESIFTRIVHGRDDAKLLLTLPGVDVVIAVTVLAALGDIARFPSGKHAASYLGLVPSVRQSADTRRLGHITKQGCTETRWMLVQAAQHIAKHPGPLGSFFRKVKSRRGHNVAVVATARKLVVIAWHMLKSREPYRYALPLTTATKLARVRVAATGARRKTGPRKGEPRHENYGSGIGTHAVPALGDVYRSEGLPELPPLAAGEQRMIEASGSAEHVQHIHTPHRIPRRREQKQAQGESPQT